MRKYASPLAGVALRDLACDGSPNVTVIGPIAVEFAVAFSDAVTTVLTACDSGRGAAAIPCAVNMDTIASVVTQQVRTAFHMRALYVACG